MAAMADIAERLRDEIRFRGALLADQSNDANTTMTLLDEVHRIGKAMVELTKP